MPGGQIEDGEEAGNKKHHKHQGTQGFLETSNVSVVEQVVNMITAQRAYEASSKGITTSDEMINLALQMKR